jgi:hypothetical protein
MRNKKKLIWIAPLAIVGIAVFVWIGGEVVMHLWNWLLPPLFGWKEITFWQALGLLALCRILFGGLASHGGPRSSFRRKMRDRWEGMTPEEREKFRQAMRTRCGPAAPPDPTPTP